MKLWRDIKDFVLSFYYPKGQYFLVSFPKTGRTWLMYMLNQIQDLSNHPLKESKNFIFNEHDNSEIIIENGYRNNPKDVFRYTNRFRYRRSKVIFLVRDPRDVVVSHFYQVTKRAKNPFVFNSITDFIKDDLAKDEVAMKDLIENLESSTDSSIRVTRDETRNTKIVVRLQNLKRDLFGLSASLDEYIQNENFKPKDFEEELESITQALEELKINYRKLRP